MKIMYNVTDGNAQGVLPFGSRQCSRTVGARRFSQLSRLAWPDRRTMTVHFIFECPSLQPLYYNMLSTDSNPEVAEMLLAEAADLDVVDMHGNTALHQVSF